MYKKFLVCLVAVGLFATGCGCEKQTEGDTDTQDKVVNEEVLKDQEVGGLKITDVEMIPTDEYTIFNISIENTSDKDVEVNNFNIYFKDKDGKLLLEDPVNTPFYNTIKAGETQTLSISTPHDLSAAASVEYEIAD